MLSQETLILHVLWEKENEMQIASDERVLSLIVLGCGQYSLPLKPSRDKQPSVQDSFHQSDISAPGG